MARTRENRLNGLFPLSYLGVNSVSPQNLVQVVGAPTPNDSKNFYIGDLWLDRTNETLTPAIPPTLNDLYVLLALDGGVATWAPFSGGVENLDLLTSNSGGPVGPLGGNINLLGDTTTIVGVGNPATHTITFSTPVPTVEKVIVCVAGLPTPTIVVVSPRRFIFPPSGPTGPPLFEVRRSRFSTPPEKGAQVATPPSNASNT